MNLKDTRMEISERRNRRFAGSKMRNPVTPFVETGLRLFTHIGDKICANFSVRKPGLQKFLSFFRKKNIKKCVVPRLNGNFAYTPHTYLILVW